MSALNLSMIVRFVLTFLVLQGLTLGGCYLVFRPFKRPRIWRWVLVYLLSLNCGYFFMFAPPDASLPVTRLIEYGLLYPFFIYTMLCMLLAPLALVGGVLYCFMRLPALLRAAAFRKRSADDGRDAGVDSGRRACVKLLASGVICPLAASSTWGAYVGNQQMEVVEKQLAFADLPPGMAGYSIVQLSDIHAGPFMDGYRLRRFVAAANRLEPDIAVVTGDIMNWGSDYLEQAAEALGELRARQGVFAVLGNHDFYSPVDGLCSRLEAAGITVLRNASCRLEGGLYLVGVDDPRGSWFFNDSFASLQQALQGVPGGSFRVLLSHRPNIFDCAASRGIQLTLAGHTHGGQVILPRPGGHGLSLARMAYERDYGLYRSGGSYLYINKGLGVVGPPVRLNCPSEITRIVLTRSPAPPTA
ncbi:metallophosphoesterase [Thermodesulfobacteriota bacterium]